MSEYKIEFCFSTGRPVTVTTSGQPDDLTEFMNKLSSSGYQSYMSDNKHATIINMNNVLYAVVEKVN